MPTTVQGVAGTLPAGYCPATLQAYYNDMWNLSSFIITGSTGFNFGDSEPTPENRGVPWLRTVAGAPDRWYVWFSGAWLWPHEVPPSGSERRMWVGLEADLITYDGGEAGAITLTAGAFWEVDHNYDFRFPLGPGTSALGTVISVNDTGGEEKHTLTIGEMPAHAHDIKTFTGVADGGGGGNPVVLDKPYNTTNANAVQSAGGGAAHNTLPLYRGTFVIKRSLRQYRRAI